MGGEERVGAGGVQVLQRGLGDGKAVQGTGAAPHLVEDHQAAVGGGVQDGGQFGHLDHEGAAPARQVVGRADAGVNGVVHREFGAVGGHEGTDLVQQGAQGHGAQVGAFPGHVRPGEQQREAVRVHLRVIGNELAPGSLLDDRVAGLGQARLAPGGVGARPALLGGDLGQGGQYVQFGQGTRRFRQRLGVRGEGLAQFGEHVHLQASGGQFQPGDLAFVFAQVGAGEAGAVFQRGDLAVIGGHLAQVRPGDLQVVPEHVVVPDLQAAYSGACPLGDFQLGQPFAVPHGSVSQVVQFGVKAVADQATVPDADGRVFNHRGADAGHHVWEAAQAGANAAQQAVLRGQQSNGFRQQFQRAGQRSDFAGRSTARGDAGGQAFQIVGAVQQRPNAAAQVGRTGQQFHAVQPGADAQFVEQRGAEPRP